MFKIHIKTLHLCVFVLIFLIHSKVNSQEFFNKNLSKISLIIEANPAKVYQFVEQNSNFKIGSRVDNYFTIYTDQIGYQNLRKQAWIKRMEYGNKHVYPLMDSSRILNNVDSVHQGIAPLVSNYKGRNVVVGIIDFGIEWRHLDFKNSATDTRILSIWDQNKDSIAPTGYSYGHLWSKSAIDAGQCKHAANAQFGHGTNVAGIAVGNGAVKSENRGIATEAKIIAVSLKNNNAWLSNIVDGINYIFAQADSLGLPCVINISVGDYDGSHDGRDASTRMIETTLSKKGRAIVAAAGNAGNLNQHIRFQPANDTSFTDFVYTPAYGGTYFNFWADTADVINLTIGLETDSSTTLLPISKRYFFDFKSKFLDSLRKYGYYEDSILIKNNQDSVLGQAFLYVLKQENTVNFQCYIVPKKTTYLWRFSAMGLGKIDMWVNGSIQGSSNIVTTLPTISTNPEISKYKLSDQTMSLTTGFQCSDKIITVANYVNKYGIIDVDTIYRPIGGKQNEIASNSSKGPTRDGRLKPDIAASGGQTITAVDSLTAASFKLSPTNRKKLGITGHYSVAGGTSMASPVVAGCVALLMEKSPHLDYKQIKYLLQTTTRKDSFTTLSPNNTYGHGKINAFQLLKYNPTYGCRDTGSINYNPLTDFEDSGLCIKKVYGCKDTGSINYNPLANVDNGSCIKKIYGCTDTGSINFNPNANLNNGSCIKKVYGCTDTGSINFNPLANVNNGSCIKKVYGCMDSAATNYNPLANVSDSSCLYANVSILNSSDFGIKIYPNPTKNSLQIQVPSISKKLHLNLVDILGNTIFKLSISQTNIQEEFIS
jgi:subtilisin family serine protease